MPIFVGSETNGMTDASVVYVDTNPFMYALEGAEDVSRPLMDLFSLFRSRPGLAVTSELTIAEYLPQAKVPERLFYDLIIWSKAFTLTPVTRDILSETVTYRRATPVKRSDGSQRMLSLPDAIHGVTAIRCGCRFLLSSDAGLKVPDPMSRIQADRAGIARLLRELA